MPTNANAFGTDMKLGEFLTMYRERNGLTIQTLDKIAKGTGQDIDSLLKFLDGDQPVTITTSPNNLSDEQATVLKVYDELPSDGRRDFWGYLEFLKFKYPTRRSAMAM